MRNANDHRTFSCVQISTAVMAMKLQLVMDAETFFKKKLIHHSVMITCYDMSTHALATQKETEKMPIMSYTCTNPWYKCPSIL